MSTGQKWKELSGSGIIDRKKRLASSLHLAVSGWMMLVAALPVAAFAQGGDEAGTKPDDPAGEKTARPGAIMPNAPWLTMKKPRENDTLRNDFTGSAADVAAANAGLFLGFSTVNGREVSGAGNTRVNDLKQFPVELMRTDVVQRYTTAKDIEGALLGTFTTTTIKPLDLKKRRFQAEVRGAYYPYAQRAHQGLGHRISASYVDQFNTDIGRIGISLGASFRALPQPREYYESGTNYKPCNSVDPGTAAGGSATTGVCSYNASSKNPLYYASASATYRQERVTEKVQGYFGQLEWQPSDRLDINIDVEHSHRKVSRYRSQFDLTDVWSGITPLDIAANGDLLKWKGASPLEVTSFQRKRDERYTGVGWNTRWHASDRMTIDADASFQRTARIQTDISTTLDSNSSIGPGGLIPYTITESDSGFASVDFGHAINLNDPSIFTENPALRRGYEQRADRIWALRLDGTYQLGGFFRAVKVGLRLSDHIRHADLKTYGLSSSNIGASNVATALNNCGIPTIVDDWASEAGTNINSWAQFDPTCMFTTLAGTSDPDTTLKTLTGGGLEASERVMAAYAMTDVEGAIGGMKLDGNIGLRLVDTESRTRVYKYSSNLSDLTGVSNYTGSLNILPSASFALHPDHRVTIRAGLARALMRSNIEGFGLRRILQGTLGNSVRLPPLLSWNADLGVEYHPDRDTMLMLNLSYKLLNQSVWPGDALIPGGPTLPAWLASARTRGSYIRGFEVGVNRTFHALPAPFNGLALRTSYAFYDSNFQFLDPTATDPANPLYLYVPTVGVPGLARSTVAVGGEYTYHRLRLGVRYEYNSGFFRPTGFTANRYRRENQLLNANVNFQVNPHAELLFTASNLTNQPEQYMRPNQENTGQTPYYGRSFTAALRVRY